MSPSTVYLIAVSIVPAALGVLLLTLAGIDALRSKAGRSQQPSAEPQSPGFGSLFHRGATQ